MRIKKRVGERRKDFLIFSNYIFGGSKNVLRGNGSETLSFQCLYVYQTPLVLLVFKFCDKKNWNWNTDKWDKELAVVEQLYRLVISY